MECCVEVVVVYIVGLVDCVWNCVCDVVCVCVWLVDVVCVWDCCVCIVVCWCVWFGVMVWWYVG